VNIFTKRNALVGFLTLKAASRKRMLRRKQSKRSTWKLATLVVLGILSVGVLAALGAVILRRQREPEHLEGYVEVGEDVAEIPSAYADAIPEPSTAA
jgi:hypothetical protein